ncbi:uncharacterized protein LY89DRAFT_783260 [Mollisia scopiformis]|uniref:Clr5 domain-containing protein n=1 Tax=Mollisia scopiformis TaxID=149040 RepID=A0A194X782_MOLSC|nr:uncharacterized protein LY89DRAFT_783260 [Mollisia scopiformis]KUJ16030.1 hypothetical protein LY89DRAFT_783260 [Mollisia scopiformis]
MGSSINPTTPPGSPRVSSDPYTSLGTLLRNTSPVRASKRGKTLVRNDALWETIRDDIFQIYMAQDNTLPLTMLLIETRYNFKRSERKWKAKLKEWNFVKNVTKAEMKVVVAKAEKRATEDGKDTLFLHHGNIIPPEKVANWKRRLTTMAATPANPYAKTPATIAYFTPIYHSQPNLEELQVFRSTFSRVTIGGEVKPKSLFLPARYSVRATGQGPEEVVNAKPVPPSGRNRREVENFDYMDNSTTTFSVSTRGAWRSEITREDLSTFPSGSVLSITEYFAYTLDSVQLGSGKLESILASWSIPEIKSRYHALEYLQLQVKRDGRILRFRPGFIRDFITCHTDDINSPNIPRDFTPSDRLPFHHAELQDSVYAALLEELGLALVRNDDSPRAIIIASIMVQSLDIVSRGGTPDSLVGRWHHDQDFFETSIPYLQNALRNSLYHIRQAFGWDFALARLLGDMLDKSYQQLGWTSAWDWRQDIDVSEHGLGKTICELSEERVALVENDFETDDLYFQFIQPLLRSIAVHIMTPLQIARIYNNIYIHILRREADDRGGCGFCQLETPVVVYFKDANGSRKGTSSKTVCDRCELLMKNSIQHLEVLMTTTSKQPIPDEALELYVNTKRRLIAELNGLPGSQPS